MKTIIHRINELAKYLNLDEHNLDLAFEIICKLRQVHETARSSEYSKPELDTLILGKNDCLANINTDQLPAAMLAEIKNLQQEIIDTYGLQD